jgi:hypothetical protein
MANYVVTTLDDEDDAGATATTPLGNGLSLREALALANGNGTATPDTITFDATLSGGTLTLTTGELLISTDGIAISGDIDLDGKADITVSGNNASRVFSIDGTGAIAASLDALIIRDGSDGNGGGIRVADDTLVLTNSTVTANAASGHGGAIHSSGVVHVTNTTLSGNQSASYGGGVFNAGTELNVLNSTILGNHASYGGGVFNRYGSATLTNTTVAGNDAAFGGGIFATDGVNPGNLALVNSTVTGNFGTSEFGGVVNTGATATATITNSIIAGNDSAGGIADDLHNAGLLTLTGGNIVGDELTIDGASPQAGIALSDIFASVTNNPDTGVLSGALGDNGGPVQTIALNAAATNPALDAGDDTSAPATDARGAPRDDASAAHNGTNISDLGAFELQSTPTAMVVTTLSDTVDDGYGGGDIAAEMADGDGLSLREALALANADPDANSITFDAALAGGTLTLNSAELVISSDVTISGDVDGDHRSDIAIDADGNSRVLHVSAGTVTLDALIITGGSEFRGGGVWIETGAVATIANTVVLDNEADNGGGGGINNAGDLTLINSALVGNETTSAGGGLSNTGTATLINTTLSGNQSNSVAGGFYNGGTATLTHTTLSGNEATSGGGGIFNNGALTLSNSIVAGNAASAAADLVGMVTVAYQGVNVVGVGSDTDASDHVIQTPTLGDLFAHVMYDPFLDLETGLLADNGGAVPTIAIKVGGVAQDTGSDAAAVYDDDHNAGTPDVAIPTDARGFARVDGAHVDIGAFEQQTGTSFVVTTLEDELGSLDPNATLADFGGAGDLSLREALVLASQDDPTAVDTITFAPSLIGGGTPGVDDGVLLLTQGDLIVRSSVIIDGDVNGDHVPDITIDAQGNSRAFTMFSGTSTLNGLALKGGYAFTGGAVTVGYFGIGIADVTISDSVIDGNDALYGGGIAVDIYSTLRLSNSSVTNNSADYVGGGIANKGTLTVRSSIVSGNSAGYIGGGIANSGTMTAVNTTITGNQTTDSGSFGPSAGAGLYNDGDATVVSSTIAGNTGAEYGGGIYNNSILTLINATIANNAATLGGGLYNSDCGCADTQITNATFSGNFASDAGGGIYHAAGALDLANTIVAGNGAGIGDPEFYSASGTVTASGPNLFAQSGTGLGTTETDLTKIFASLTTIDPDGTPGNGDEFLAGLLANNGGPVQTILITALGVALNAGDNSALPPDTENLDGDGNTSEALPLDARGLTRIVASTVDIGAVELQPNLAPVNTLPGGTQQIEANVATAIAGLSIADGDAGTGSLTTTLSVDHGTLTVAAVGGAGVGGSGSATVTITGTLAQINATLAAAGNLLYQGAHDYFGADALHVVTSDNGNNGTGGPLSDTDSVAINLTTWLIGTSGPDSYTALPGNERIDAGHGIDTITFGFNLTDATFTWQGNELIIDGPGGSHTLLTGFETYVFLDGTVNNNDGNWLVDDLYYYANNHDVWNAHVDADAHYDVFGWHERRDPNAFFSTTTYLALNPDVKNAGVNPLGHWQAAGWTEGRVPSFAFDPQQYLAENPDVAAAGINPLLHFLAVGAGEGRTPTAVTSLINGNGFDAVYYLQQNPDVAAAEIDPFLHFQTVGWHEGRNPNALFDVAGYLSHYTDVAAAGINPLDHYHVVGWQEHRDPSLAFDTAAYLAANPDVAAAHIDPLWHYLRLGIHEGRTAIADGTWG